MTDGRESGPLQVGQEVGRYRVEEVLGEGGMAVVYRARHTRLDTQHALKVLTGGGKRTRARLLTEGQVQASLKHPNAVVVRDILEVDGAPVLVMEFVDGPDLEAWIATERPDPGQAEAVFRQILDALEAAHAAGLVHRDLKPANVLMQRDGDGWIAKVADFGIAKVEGGAGATRTGVVMGTPEFMAPEQLRSARDVDARADVFALGCLLYQLVCGQPPFRGTDLIDLFGRIEAEDYVPPTERLPELPAHLAEAIRGCLRADPDRRLPSCAAVREVLDGGVLPPPSLPVPVPARAAPDPRPWLLSAAVVGLTALFVALVFVAALLALRLPAVPELVEEEPEVLCGHRRPEVVGFVRGQGIFFNKHAGDTWRLPYALDVRDDYPRDENGYRTDAPVVCTLPRGTVLAVEQEPIRVRRYGKFVPVLGSAITLPPGEP